MKRNFRSMLKKTIFPILLSMLFLFGSCGEKKDNPSIKENMNDNGLVVKVSDNDFETTYGKLKGLLEGNPNLKVLLALDHSKNAASVDLQLPPTRIIMFGNPNLGTPLMQSGSSTAIDLPQKIVVSQGEGGQVTLTYNDPNYLVKRHGLKGVDAIITKISVALDKITSAAAAK